MPGPFYIRADNEKRAQVREYAAQCVAVLNLDESWKVSIEYAETEQSRIQQEKYHAMIGDIAKQMKTYDGRLGDSASWKRLLVDQFKADTLADSSTDERIIKYWRRNPLKIVPSLDGERLVTMGEQTRRFPIYVSTAFISWLDAFGGEHGVRWTEKERAA